MYCTKCGAKMNENDRFCPKCGMAVQQSTEAKNGAITANTGDEAITREQTVTKNNSASRFWDHPLFTMLAIKFGNLLDVLIGIVSCLLSILLFPGAGLIAKGMAVILLIAGIVNIVTGVKQFFTGNKESDTPEELNKKKRNLCIGAVVIVLGLVLLHNMGGTL